MAASRPIVSPRVTTRPPLMSGPGDGVEGPPGTVGEGPEVAAGDRVAGQRAAEPDGRAPARIQVPTSSTPMPPVGITRTSGRDR